ncbi:hypothetical protein QAD02_014291 [Eretmocerus hayati]|uniref:Uncharacterized protein n=1 Tax=Eretmocerus hayati TaxID=131215 RepID=A0ACC2P4H4_9HYME|nr:hypothetical protein QAD02_014291 [Eretmocerus hayati]
MSDVEIPQEIIQTISLGPNFSHGSNFDKQTTIGTVKNVEKLFETHEFDEHVAGIIRGYVTENIFTHSKRITNNIRYTDECLQQKIKSAKSFSKEYEILSTMADRGNVTVAIKTCEYREKMLEMLSDRETYTVIRKNPLQQLLENVKEILYR